jgi:GNAT superfamily N-acetyltransferase
MATRELLSPAQRQRLTELPDPMDERLLARHHTLSEEDLRTIGTRRRPETKLGFAVQLCYLRFPGRPLRAGEAPPRNLLEYVAAQVGEKAAAFDGYAKSRDTTRREHLSEIVRAFGFGPFDAEARRELYEHLLPVATGTDRGTALVEAALAELRARGIVSPAITTVEELCWEVRRDARGSVLRKLTADLSPELRGRLDGLLEVQPGGSRAPLVWLREPPSSPGPKNFRKIVEKLEFVRDLGLPRDPGGGIHNNRLSQLAREGAKTTPQHLRRFDPYHRHATLVAYLSERSATLADEALDMHDRLVGEMLGKGEKARDENFRKRGKAINEKVGLYAAVGKALIDARETGDDPYAAIEVSVGWERFVGSIEEAEELALPADFDYLEHLDGQYRRLRGYAPALLETFEFSAAPPAEPLLEAVGVLREMNATGKREVPDDAPTSFVKPRWERHVFDGGGIDRRYYEMSAVTELKNGLKSGDVWVPGSRKYADFEDYLLPRPSWERVRANGRPPVAVDPNLDRYLAGRSGELHRELSEVGRLISRGKLRDVRLEDGELRVSRAKTEVPKGTKEFTQKVYDLPVPGGCWATLGAGRRVPSKAPMACTKTSQTDPSAACNHCAGYSQHQDPQLRPSSRPLPRRARPEGQLLPPPGCNARPFVHQGSREGLLRFFGPSERRSGGLLSPAVGDVLRGRPLRAPAHGGRGGPLERPVVPGLRPQRAPPGSL